ncbi:MAG: pyridoxamine 5'-phosphate oxidase family protein [Bryobacteraceae bacterium]
MTDKTDIRNKVYDIIKGFSNAMLVSLGPSGRPTARPMHVAHLEHIDEDLGSIWFFTSKGGALVDEVAKEPVVLLAFQNENSAYVSLRGRARVVENREKIRSLFKEPYKVWFPAGDEDPDVVLLAVDPIDAEYWDNRGMNKLEYMFEAAKAYVKGEKPDVAGIDQHAKTNL